MHLSRREWVRENVSKTDLTKIISREFKPRQLKSCSEMEPSFGSERALIFTSA
jgi:hypothetical protein